MTSINPTTSLVIMGVFTLIGIAGQTALPDWIPPDIAKHIQSTCVWISVLGNGISAFLHSVSSSAPGPLTKS